MPTKKSITINLICILILCVSALDGFDVKFNKFIDFYFIDQSKNWGNLYIEGVEVDFKAAALAQKKLKGGYFDENSHSVIPHDFAATEKEWKKVKDYLASLIGPVPDLFKEESSNWENSAKTVNDLWQDAYRLSLKFKSDFRTIAAKTDSIVNFGPGDQFIIKTKESLTRKVNQDAMRLKISQEEALAKIGDVLRGTIIVDDIKKISMVIEDIIRYAEQAQAKVTFKNLWKEDREFGYVGIHAKILYPLSNEQGNEIHYILAEMQIHLADMVDGTEMSAKERTHFIYEQIRVDDKPQSIELSAASKLLFLTAMEEALAKLEK